MVLNTTNGPVAVPRGARKPAINTSRVTEEDLVYVDEEPEILSVIPATGWHAVVEEERLPLLAFVAMDDGKMYGVSIGEDGLVDLVENDVEKLPGFVRYER